VHNLDIRAIVLGNGKSSHIFPDYSLQVLPQPLIHLSDHGYASLIDFGCVHSLERRAIQDDSLRTGARRTQAEVASGRALEPVITID